MVVPSDALMPATPFCETRIAGGGGKVATCLRRVSIVAVGAGGVPIIVQQHIFGCIVRIVSRGKRMSCLGELGKDVRDGRREVGAAVVAAGAVLLIRPVQQTRRSQRIVRCMAGDASIGGHRAIASQIRLPALLCSSPDCVRSWPIRREG